MGDVGLEHPITEDNLPEIFEQNKDVPLIALSQAIEYKNQINALKYKRAQPSGFPKLFNWIRR